MYLCICRAVTETRVEGVIDAGASSCAAVEAACGAGGDCGTCRAEIVKLIRVSLSGSRRAAEAA